MTPWATGLLAGLVCTLSVAAGLGLWLPREPETRVVVAARDIPESTPITLPMLDDAWVPRRFVSGRKLGAVNVAAVMGHPAPQALRARDFVDPTHFGPTDDACVLDARATGQRLGLDGAQLDAFVAALKAMPVD